MGFLEVSRRFLEYFWRNSGKIFRPFFGIFVARPSLIQSLTGPCAGGQILAAVISQSDWSFNNRAVNGSKLSTTLAHNFNATAMAKEQVCRGKCVALRYSCRSRRIVIISFSPENGVRFDASCLSLGAEKYINSEICIPFYRIVSRNFHLKAFSWY